MSYCLRWKELTMNTLPFFSPLDTTWKNGIKRKLFNGTFKAHTINEMPFCQNKQTKLISCGGKCSKNTEWPKHSHCTGGLPVKLSFLSNSLFLHWTDIAHLFVWMRGFAGRSEGRRFYFYGFFPASPTQPLISPNKPLPFNSACVKKIPKTTNKKAVYNLL